MYYPVASFFYSRNTGLTYPQLRDFFLDNLYATLCVSHSVVEQLAHLVWEQAIQLIPQQEFETLIQVVLIQYELVRNVVIHGA